MKIFFRRIHLYLSVLAGLVIMISCITGSILVFEQEIEESIHGYRYYVEPGTERLPLNTIAANFHKEIDKAKINYYKIYNDPARSLVIGYVLPSKEDKEKKPEETKDKSQAAAKDKPKQKERKQNVIKAFMNPYTGELIDTQNYRETFFYKVFSLHRWLLSGDTGKLIVGISTSIFLFIILTGIILWWPKTRKILQQRVKIRWKVQSKRLAHDLHTVLGFYACIFLFVSAFTGLAWSFEWFNKGIYKVTRSSMEQPKAPSSGPADSVRAVDIYTSVYKDIWSRIPEAKSYQLNAAKDSAASIVVSILANNATHENANDQYYYDQYSMEYKGQLLYSERNLGQRVRSTFKPVHTGSIFGISSKIIAFTTCLIGASLPVTGSIMWRNRQRKKNK